MEFGSLLMNGFLFSLQLKKIHMHFSGTGRSKDMHVKSFF